MFSLQSAQHPLTEVDLSVEPPFEFESAYERAHRADLGSGVEATFVGLANLLQMKREAGRPRDLEDIAELESLRREGEPEDGR